MNNHKNELSGVIKFRINQDFLIEHSCTLHIRSNLLLLYFVIRTYHDLLIRYLLLDKHKLIVSMDVLFF